MKYIKLNENIALAKSILRKNGIAEDNEDYLKIREMVGTAFSYVGILTRLRFVDNVTDMEELKSIFEVLKNSKLDLGKLNKMSYEQILDTFYEDLTTSTKKNDDYELIYKDKSYSFFRVYTYKGILELGSPAWCLKTKSFWNKYQSEYPEQWVVIDNRYIKSIVTPNNNYFTDTYRNTNKRWVRYGVSLRHNSNDTWSFVAHDDNDGKCTFTPSSHTFYGVLNTIFNLSKGFKKSYFQKFPGTEYIRDGVLKIVNDNAWNRLNIKAPENKDDINYLYFSKSYSFVPAILRLRDRSFPVLRYLNNSKDCELLEFEKDGLGYSIMSEYVSQPRNVCYSGLRVKFGHNTKEKFKEHEDFITEVGKWFVYEWNDDFFIVVDSNPEKISIPVINSKGEEFWTDKEGNLPIFYFVDAKTIKNAGVTIETEESKEILRQLRRFKGNKPLQEEPIVTTQQEEKPGFIKRFFGFK